MPARHLSNVDLPEPLRPTMPKNSPGSIANDTLSSASKRSEPLRLNGCSARSFSVCTRSWGTWNVFDTQSTMTAVTASLTAGKVPSAPARAYERQPDGHGARNFLGPLHY